MNKTDLINKIVDQSGQSKSEVKYFLDCLMTSIYEGLEQTGSVRLTGLGTLRIRLKAQHNARNPKTGEVLVIPTKSVARFKVGKTLKLVAQAIKQKQ